MSWEPDSKGVMRWAGDFEEPDDDELYEYGWLGNRMQHGTNHGYKLHLKRGETACDECKAAHAAYERERSAA